MKAHSKNGSKASTKELGSSDKFDFDARVLGATGRKPSSADSIVSEEGGLERTASASRAGVGMVPGASNSLADPLVCDLHMTSDESYD